MIDYQELKQLFPDNLWDVAYLSPEVLHRSGTTPIKTVFNEFGKFYDELEVTRYGGIILARYSTVSNDYSLYDESLKILKKRYGNKVIATYTNFKEAVCLSGIGQWARNSLIYNRKFGFQCKYYAYTFTERVINADIIAPNTNMLDLCTDCDDCIKNCPVGAISSAGIDAKKCGDFLAFGNHPTIPSGKWLWFEKMRPNVSRETVESWTTWENTPKYKWGEGIDGFYEMRGGRLFRDGDEITIPICRECQQQPKCSKAPHYEK